MYVQKFLLIYVYFILIKIFCIVIIFLKYYDYFTCYDCTEMDSVQNNIFDYIVVGSGSAGSIVARRLSQDGSKVLILEAGPQNSNLLDIPSICLLLQDSNFDWKYRTIPQTSSCFALKNNESRWPMGKIVGGTSMLNNLIYVRGHKTDFEEWFPTKNYNDDILPYFKKVEDSIKLTDLPYTTILSKTILKAAAELEFPILNDNLECNLGFSSPKINIVNGKRYTSSHRLKSVMKHRNIVFRTQTTVNKVIFNDNFEATAVRYSYLRSNYFARATKGIILSAGVIGSPKILMLSGIGPKNHLENVNIKTKIDLPVGENLQDHVTTGLDLVLLNNQSLDIGIPKLLSPFSIYDYFWNGNGPWTTVGCEALGFVNTESNRPDLQFMIMPLGISEDFGVHLRNLIGIKDDTFHKYFSLLNESNVVTFLPVVLHPKSRGFVRLADRNPESPPVINPNYLNDESDIDVLLYGIDLIKKLIGTKSLQELGAKLNSNVFPGCEQFLFDSKSYWRCYVKHFTISAYHPVGTCSLGNVVDFDFKVKGTNNLFVVDGSVLPSLPSGNPNGSVMMLAEMAADIIRFINYVNTNKCKLIEIFYC